jgi:hypothetical protein
VVVKKVEEDSVAILAMTTIRKETNALTDPPRNARDGKGR